MTDLEPMRFSQKLDELPQTLALRSASDHARIAEAFRQSASCPAIAIGSGGSAVTAAYFARCRETLTGDPTMVQTPVEFVLGAGSLDQADVWLFSAGADNADFRAALQAAHARNARRINVLTRRDAAASLGSNGDPPISVHVVPVAEEKDGYIATHSLVAAIAALHDGANLAAHDGAPTAPGELAAAALRELAGAQRQLTGAPFSTIGGSDLLMLIADPQLAAVATLIETSLFESALCAVQRTDIRNFAHGRHSWLHHRREQTFVLALVGDDTEPAWQAASALLPASVRRHAFSFGSCGRFHNALGIVLGLIWIEAIGKAVGIDPGKPGIGDFGRALYSDNSLEDLSLMLGPAVRQKRSAMLERDDPGPRTGICVMDKARLERLRSASIAGLVLDYDGTIVTTERRLDLPSRQLVDELVRLHDLGVRLGIATGRGGSAGNTLRRALPERMYADVLVGYYNGGHIRPLSVDVEEDRPDVSPHIAAVAAWLADHDDLLPAPINCQHSRVQITIRLDDIPDLGAFLRAIGASPPFASGNVRIVRSGHSVDIVPVTCAKANVVSRLAAELGRDAVVLRVGDKGASGGNDHDFLTDPYGISVEDVCGRDDGCWSLYGLGVTGPEALCRLLGALKPHSAGRVRLNVDDLELDGWQAHEYKRRT